MDTVVITNPRICNFYKENPFLDIETTHLFLIDMLSHVLEKTPNRESSHQQKDILLEDIKQFLSTMQPSSSKESKPTNMHSILNKLYSMSEIYYVKPNQTQKIDPTVFTQIILKRNNKSRLYIQSADIERNITLEEIASCLDVMEEQNSHGIFMSQRSGFINKPNFHIEIHNKLILVFLHHADYSLEKIKIAIEMIDSLSQKMRECHGMTNDFEFSIEKESLEEINKEFLSFSIQKESMVSNIKENHKKTLVQLDELKLPSLEKYLSTKFSSVPHKQGFKCDLCKNFLAHNLKALAAHKRGCNRKHNILVKPTANKLVSEIPLCI